MESDKLKFLFDKQMEFQMQLHDGDQSKIIKNQEYINIMTLATICELMEALQETKWKPWKKSASFEEEKFKEELIDVWHFIINLSLASGMTQDEVFSRYCAKHQINRERQQNKY